MHDRGAGQPVVGHHAAHEVADLLDLAGAGTARPLQRLVAAGVGTGVAAIGGAHGVQGIASPLSVDGRL